MASRNRKKLAELRRVRDGAGVALTLLSLDDVAPFDEAPEAGATFEENALAKARDAFRASGLPSVADDSGLEVDALDGAPGVHSARFAALDKTANSSDADNNAKLLRLLKDVPAEKRTARFRCVLALTPVLEPSETSASPVCAADEFELQTELFDGACEGRIGLAAAGQGGFGYDPLFLSEGWKQSFAELGEDVKNTMSHRAHALAKLGEHLRKRALQ